jgi:hypothetical protein
MNARVGAMAALLIAFAAWAAEGGQTAPAAASQPAGERVVLASFESGLDGFRGEMKHDATAGHTGKGAGRMTADFAAAKGPPWITASKMLNLRWELRGVRFWVRSTEAGGLTLRLVDDTGQAHQQSIAHQLSLSVQAGSLVDFALTPGAGVNVDLDAATFTARIEAVTP